MMYFKNLSYIKNIKHNLNKIYGEYWTTNYSKSGPFSCANCEKIKYNSYIVGLLTLWTLISMTIAIRGDIDALENKAAAYVI